MKGIILAGGEGSRLFPLTKVTNKHLLPVGNKPMLIHAVIKMREAGIRKIMLVTGTEHMGAIVSLLGSGKEYDCEFTFRVQDEAGGIAQALSLAENFVHQDKLCVILGDNIFEDSLIEEVKAYSIQASGARVILKEVSDPERFGVARFENGKITEILEKPENPPSSQIVTGIYFYDHRVFEIIRGLKPSQRGEYEISDVNNAYLQRGELSYGEFQGEWTDAGTFPSYHRANQLIFRSLMDEESASKNN